MIASLYEDVPVFFKEAFAAPADWLEENPDVADRLLCIRAAWEPAILSRTSMPTPLPSTSLLANRQTKPSWKRSLD